MRFRDIRKNVGIFFYWSVLSIKGMASYHMDFVLGLVSTTLLEAVNIFFLWVIFTKVHVIAGWTLSELILFYGLFSLSSGIAYCIAVPLLSLPRKIVRGDLDIHLVRPIPPLLSFISGGIGPGQISRLATSLLVVILACSRLNIDWTWIKILRLLSIAPVGAAIFVSIMILAACTAFWHNDTDGFLVATIMNVVWYGRYPLSIYNRYIRGFLTLLIPAAFISFLPSTYLFGYLEYNYLSIMSPLIALVFLGLAGLVWHFSLLRYESTGS